MILGTLTVTFSTRPPSSVLEILTPDRDAKSSEDGLMPTTAYHCYCEYLTALRRSTARLTQAQTAATSYEQDAVSTWLQGSKTALPVTLSEITAGSANIAIPESEKKFHWVKCEPLTKSCTQSRAPRNSSSGIITRYRLMMNFSPEVTGPRKMRVVSWNTWRKPENSLTTRTIKRLYLNGQDTYFKKMLASKKTSLLMAKQHDVTYIRKVPRWRPLQL